jgi:hypothetical protein
MVGPLIWIRATRQFCLCLVIQACEDSPSPVVSQAVGSAVVAVRGIVCDRDNPQERSTTSRLNEFDPNLTHLPVRRAQALPHRASADTTGNSTFHFAVTSQLITADDTDYNG